MLRASKLLFIKIASNSYQINESWTNHNHKPQIIMKVND